MGCSRGVSGLFRAVPGCSGFYRHPAPLSVCVDVPFFLNFLSSEKLYFILKKLANLKKLSAYQITRKIVLISFIYFFAFFS